MEHIHLPSTIEFQEGSSPNVGQMIVTPCQQGYGTTLGNSLRRVLLSSLPGAAVESIKIEGVQHEFSAIEGVLEDVVEVILNFKQMAVRVHGDEPVVLNLSKKGKGVITPADFDKNADVEIINPDLKLMTVTDGKTLNMEVTVGNGSGYVPVAEKNTKDLPLGTIAIDSLYTPIRDVGYNVELTRVGDVTDFEKLVVNIETNGSVTPKEAVAQATKVLMDHFALILDSSANGSEEATEEATKLQSNEEASEEDEVTKLQSDEEVVEEEEKPSADASLGVSSGRTQDKPAKKTKKKKEKKEEGASDNTEDKEDK